MGEPDAASHDGGLIPVLRDVLEQLGASDSQALAEIVWLHLDHPQWAVWLPVDGRDWTALHDGFVWRRRAVSGYRRSEQL